MKTLAERFPRPNLVKRINLMADTVGGAAELICLDANQMIEASRRVTGLSDFGDRIDGDWQGRARVAVKLRAGFRINRTNVNYASLFVDDVSSTRMKFQHGH